MPIRRTSMPQKTYAVATKSKANRMKRRRLALELLEDRSLLAAGAIDTSFGTSGIFRVDLATSSEGAARVVVQPDGKLVTAGSGLGSTGNWDFVVARFLVDGGLDPSFGTGGKIVVPIGTGDDFAESLVIQDGKILVVGETYNGSNNDVALIRLTAAGQLDNSFGTSGIVKTPFGPGHDNGREVAVSASTGEIYVVGDTQQANQDMMLLKYDMNGSLVTSFGSGGKLALNLGAVESANAIAIQPSNGYVAISGYVYNGTNFDFAMARVTSTGALDPQFGAVGTPGAVTFAIGNGADYANSMVMLPGGTFVLAGFTTTGTKDNFAIAQVRSNGQIETAFGTSGKTVVSVGVGNDRAQSITVQPDGKLIVAGLTTTGSTLDMGVIRLTATGALDVAFDGDGKKTIAVMPQDDLVYSVAMQGANKAILLGNSSNGTKSATTLARVLLNSNPIVNTSSFLTSGTLVAGATSLQVAFDEPISFSLGSQERPAASAVQIRNANPSASSGIYWIDPNGGSTSDAFQVYCDMTTDGGGWMLAVNSVLGAEPTSNDINSNTGTVGLSTPQTRNLNTYFAGTATAEVRHEIDGSNVGLGRFHGKYTADVYQAPFSGVTTLSGHSNSALLQGSFNAPFVNNPSGAPWFYNGNSQTTLPASPASGSPGPLYLATGQILSSYRIWIRGDVSVTSGGAGGAEQTSNYELRRAGSDGLLGNADDPIITISSSTISNNTATLSFGALPEDVYRLTVKDTITNANGIQMDGDLSGTAGGNWRRDFVVGALTTSLTSPNGFVFDPEYGGFGAGQLVQGTNGAFDGLGRMFVGDVGYSPIISTTSLADVVVIAGTSDGQDVSGGGQTISGLTTTFISDGSPIRVQSSLSARILSNNGALQFRYVVDGVQRPVISMMYTQGNLDQHIPLNLEDYITGLTPGNHTISLQAAPAPGFGTSDTFFGWQNNATMRIYEFNNISGFGPSVDVTTVNGTSDGQDVSGGGQTISGLTTTFISDGSPIRVQSSLSARILSNNGALQFRYVVDGVQRPVISMMYTQGNLDQHIPLNLEDYITGLTPGNHTISLQAAPAPGFGTSDTFFGWQNNATMRIYEFNNISGFGPSVDVTTVNGTSDGQDVSGGGQTISGLTTTFISDGNPIRVQSSLSARILSNNGALQFRYVVDGVQRPVISMMYTQGNLDQHIPLNLEDYITGLTPGNHTISLQAAPAPGFGTSDTFFGWQNNATMRIYEFNAIPSPILDDAGRTVVTNTQAVSNLTVSHEATVPSTSTQDFARTVDTFTNSTGAAITTPVWIVGNLGSDASSTVFATSDGDLIVEPTDLWFGTDDADGTGTPAIIHLLHGPFGLQPSSVSVVEDNVQWTYDLTMPAGSTKRLASFTVLGTTRAEAIAAANTLVTNTAFGGQAAAFLTPQELASVANFEFNIAPTDIALSSNSVPENQPVGSSVGNLSTTDSNVGDTFAYSLVTGSGDTDNSQFSIVGNSVVTAAAFDFETKSTYLIRIRTTDSGGLTFEKALMINVTNVNEAPILTRSQASVAGNVLSTLTNSGTWSDPESGAVTLSASLGTVTKNVDGTWSWTHTPSIALLNQVVTITASDGTNVSNVTFSVTAFTTIATRGIQYLGATGASASTSLATDKVPLLPGQTSTFANYTNYSRGLNGLVIDVVGLPASVTNSQLAASLQFANWNGIAAAGFVALPGAAVPTVAIVAGGVAGSTRVRISFPDNTLQNTWLRVTVVANADTGLAANDVFYFGNVIGELDFGNTATRLRVNGQDAALMLANQSPGANSAPVTNKYDLDRNGRVNGQDYAILLANQQAAGIVAPITAPSARPAASRGSLNSSGGGSGNASGIGSAAPLPSLGAATESTNGTSARRKIQNLAVGTSNGLLEKVLVSRGSDASPNVAVMDLSGTATNSGKEMEKRTDPNLTGLDSIFATLWGRL